MTNAQAALPRPGCLELSTTTTRASHFRQNRKTGGCDPGEGCHELAAGVPTPASLLPVGLAAEVLFRHAASASHSPKGANAGPRLSGLVWR